MDYAGVEPVEPTNRLVPMFWCQSSGCDVRFYVEVESFTDGRVELWVRDPDAERRIEVGVTA